jgi:hypothetical protein
VGSGDGGAAAPEEGLEMLDALPQRTCRQVLARIDANKRWSIDFFKMDLNVRNPNDVSYSSIPYRGDDQALKTFYDPTTTNIQVSSLQYQNPCSAGSRQVLWFYPSADHNGAFNLNDFVCSRLAGATLNTAATCINVYRVNNVQEINVVLDRFTPDQTVVHAVIGGHGSNDPKGVLGLGAGQLDNVAQDAPTTLMLLKLKGKLVYPGPTIFLDSCFSGVNGLAKYVSEVVRDTWVMGGIVSLDASIDMLPGQNGPPRIASDFPTWAGGKQVIEMFANGMDLGLVTKYGAPATDPNP